MLKGLKSAIKWIAAVVIICVVLGFLASINGLSVSRTVITVAGNEITEAEFKYYVEMAKQTIASEQGIADEEALKDFLKNGEVDGKPAADVIKERALEDVIRTEIAVVKATEEKVTLSDEERSAARSVISATDAETVEMLKETKKATGADKYLIADIMEKIYLSNAYYNFVTTQNKEAFTPAEYKVLAEIENSYARVKHVLVQNQPTEQNEDGTVPDAEGYAEKAKIKAEEVLAKAVAGEDFDALIKEYGEDPGMESTPDGYVIDKTGYLLDGSSAMVPEFTKGTFAVGSNEVNPELVESSYGWHIIKRCDLTPTHADYATIEENAKSIIMYDMFDAYLDEAKASMEINVKENVISKIKVK